MHRDGSKPFNRFGVGEQTVCEDLIKLVPAVAQYRRTDLDDDLNALEPWSEAAELLGDSDDAEWRDWLWADDERCHVSSPFPADKIERIHAFLDRKEPILELLREGVRRRRVQFPDPDGINDLYDSYDSMFQLTDLFDVWFLQIRRLANEEQLDSAVEELIDLGWMGQIIRTGESLIAHYLIGSAIAKSALLSIRRLAVCESLSAESLSALSQAVDAWDAEADNVAPCLRVELCRFAIPEIERIASIGDPSEAVNQFLDRHYANAPNSTIDEEVDEDESKLLAAWRDERIHKLLDGHPDPIDLSTTVKLIGREVADRIADFRSHRWFYVTAQVSRLTRSYRRARFRYLVNLWPTQLQPAFPFELLGESERTKARLAEYGKLMDNQHVEEWRPPSDAQLEAARKKLHDYPNPLGNLLANALLCTDISDLERQHRTILVQNRAVLAER